MFPLGKSKKPLLIFMRRYFNFKTKGGKSDYSKIKLFYQWMNIIFKDWDSEGFWNCLQYLITVYFRNGYCVRHCIILVIKLSSLSYTWANVQRQTVIDHSMSPSGSLGAILCLTRQPETLNCITYLQLFALQMTCILQPTH